MSFRFLGLLTFFLLASFATGASIAYPSPASSADDDDDVEVNRRPRIVGGEVAEDVSAYQSVVRLEVNFPEIPSRRCTGTIISSVHVLTAASCLKGEKLDASGEILYIVDHSSIDIYTQQGQQFTTNEAFTHQHFDYHKRSNNIAILKLRNSDQFKAVPSNVPSAFTPYETDVVNVGYGLHEDSGVDEKGVPKEGLSSDNKLRATKLGMERVDACDHSERRHTVVCALNVFRGPEVGDVGSPLIYIEGDNHYIIGVTSEVYTPMDKFSQKPIFMRTSKYCKWIGYVVGDESHCTMIKWVPLV